MNSSLYMIVDLIFRLATMLFLVRFLLQACAADFYNPISQAIVKGSDGIAAPLGASIWHRSCWPGSWASSLSRSLRWAAWVSGNIC
jgi:hypothetical protein